LAIIDAYTHIYPKSYMSKLETLSNAEARDSASKWIARANTNPHYSNVKSRMSDLDKYGIDYQITAISQDVDPNKFCSLEKRLRAELCSYLNNEMARVMKESGGRIFSLGTLPFDSLLDEGEAIDEMRRAIHDLGLKGFMVLSNLGGEPIDKFGRFWTEAERLGVPVYIHPVDPVSNISRRYEDDFDLMHVFGWPFETTLILSRLVFSGIIQKSPNLKILAHHLGGMIPFFAGRIDESYSKTMGPVKAGQKVAFGEGRPAIDHFRFFYYDTAIGGSSAAIRCGYEVFGAERILFATDYPFGPEAGRRRLATYPSKVLDLGLSDAENKQIFEENARKLMGV
jgi:predicted TIM-barrel fold metal-dependent hydrolase